MWAIGHKLESGRADTNCKAGAGLQLRSHELHCRPFLSFLSLNNENSPIHCIPFFPSQDGTLHAMQIPLGNPFPFRQILPVY